MSSVKKHKGHLLEIAAFSCNLCISNNLFSQSLVQRCDIEYVSMHFLTRQGLMKRCRRSLFRWMSVFKQFYIAIINYFKIGYLLQVTDKLNNPLSKI